MSLRALLFLASIVAACVGCKTGDEKLCDTSTEAWKIAQRDLVARGLRSAPTEAELAVEQRRCMEAVDRLKGGAKECVTKCYARAPARDALIDCDTKCAVSVQAQ